LSKILFINFNIHHLYLDDNIPTGGATIQTSNWIRGFQQNNYEVGVLGYKGVDPSPFFKKNIDFIETYDLTKGIRIIRNVYYRIPKTFSVIKKYNPDIIFMDVPGWSTFVYVLVARLLNKIFILRISNDIFVDGRIRKKLGFIRYYIFLLSIRFVNVILCQSDYQYYSLQKKFRNKFLIKLPNPYTLIQDKPISENRRSYVAWIGLFQYQKNPGALYRIALKLSDVKFKIAGRQLIDIDKNTKQAINNLKRLNNVECVGYIKNTDIRNFLSSAYCLLNTSLYEGFSNTYLESLSAGTPIVTTSATDPDSFIKKNKFGYVGESYESLLMGITNIINNYSYEVERFRKYLNEKHDPRVLAANLIEKIKSNIHL